PLSNQRVICVSKHETVNVTSVCTPVWLARHMQCLLHYTAYLVLRILSPRDQHDHAVICWRTKSSREDRPSRRRDNRHSLELALCVAPDRCRCAGKLTCTCRKRLREAVFLHDYSVPSSEVAGRSGNAIDKQRL